MLVDGADVAVVGEQPQSLANTGTTGQYEGSIKPSRPTCCKVAHVNSPNIGVSTCTLGRVISNPSPQTLQGAKPGVGAIDVVARFKSCCWLGLEEGKELPLDR